MMKKRIPYLLAVLLLVAACNKEDAWDVLKTRGDRKVENRELAPFTGITVYNGINVVLEESNEYGARLDGWSNLLAKVTLTVDDEGMLTIEDKNKFDLVRNPQNKTTVYLRYQQPITKLTFSSNGFIRNIDTLRTSRLSISALEGSGAISLAVKAERISIGTNNRNVADIELKGVSRWLSITNWGNAPLYAEELQAESCSITHRGSGDFYVNVSRSLSVEIYSVGDIYYKGNPTISFTRKNNGKGNLIPFP